MIFSSESLSERCKARLELARREQSLFKLAPQIRLEILLAIATDDGKLTMTDLRRMISATEVAIRSHLKDLEASRLIITKRSTTDFRVKLLALSDEGQQLLSQCLKGTPPDHT